MRRSKREKVKRKNEREIRKVKMKKKKRILVLAPFIPYPLDSGGKIRVYHLIKNLIKDYEISLVCFGKKKELLSKKSYKIYEPLTKLVDLHIFSYNPGFVDSFRDLVRSFLFDKPAFCFRFMNQKIKKKIKQMIRETNLDELPQLINVILGEMSLIGPRPERKYFIEQFKKKYLWFEKRLTVQPGLTGLAQIRGYFGDSSIKKRLEQDLLYVDNLSFMLDLKIFLQTTTQTLKRVLKMIYKIDIK